MPPKLLALHARNAVDELAEELLPLLEAGRLKPYEVLGVCRRFRLAGIASLVLDGHVAEFQWKLGQSARAYAHWLARAPEEQKLGSLSFPYFDAIAAGDAGAARTVAEGSPRTHARGQEYEEDFLFVEYVMRRFSLGASAPEREALLARWQEALRGVEDPRLELCRAMEDGNARAFGKALAAVQKERERSLRAQRDSLGPEVLAAERCLWVEGVALARLADGLKLRLAKTLPLVPLAARTAKPVKVPPDAWKELWRAKADA